MKKGQTKYEKRKKQVERTAGHPTKYEQIPKRKVAQALIDSFGVLTQTAKICGCSVPNISIRIKNDPDLQAAKSFAEEIFKDDIEFNFKQDLLDKVRHGIHKDDWSQVKYFMKTQMADRGYNDSKPGGHGTAPVQVNIIPAAVDEDKKKRLTTAVEIEDAQYDEEGKEEEKPDPEFLEDLEYYDN